MRLFDPFKILPAGYYRLVLVMQFLLPLIVAIIVNNTAYPITAEEDTWEALFITIIGYYILTRAGLWVYKGFNEAK